MKTDKSERGYIGPSVAQLLFLAATIFLVGLSAAASVPHLLPW
jgi:hypothetical protein